MDCNYDRLSVLDVQQCSASSQDDKEFILGKIVDIEVGDGLCGIKRVGFEVKPVIISSSNKLFPIVSQMHSRVIGS